MSSLTLLSSVNKGLFKKVQPRSMMNHYFFQLKHEFLRFINFCQLIQFIMKKAKPENISTNHSLAAKRASLNQDKLLLGYKVDWDPNLLQNTDNKLNSNKAFFQNMKEQLSTIKNDFQKLLKKQSTFNSANKPNREQTNATSYQNIANSLKGKSMSSYKKEDKRIFFESYEQPKKYEMMPQKESVNEIISNKLLNAEKKASFTQKKQLFIQNAQLREKDYYSNHASAKNSANKYSNQSQPLTQPSYKLTLAGNRDTKTPVEKESYDIAQKNNAERKEENLRLKQLISKLNEQIAIYKKDREALRNEYQKATTQKQIYMNKLTELSKELSAKMNYASQQEQKIKELSEQLKNKANELVSINAKFQEIDKQRAYYSETINELRFHNQNFHNINFELGFENQRLKQNISNLKNYIQHLNSIKENSQNDYKRKLEFNKKDIQQYQKREVMFTKQIQSLTQMLNTKEISQKSQYFTDQIQPNNSQTRVNDKKIAELTQQVQLQRQINANLTEKYEQNIKKMNILELKSSFEQKINFYIAQNTKLKSLKNNLQAQNESLNEKNRSYVQEIALYQERQRKTKTSKKLTSTQWQEMTQEIQKLKNQNKFLFSKLETKELKAQIAHLNNAVGFQVLPYQGVLHMAHNQLREIQSLKSVIADFQKQNQILTKQRHQNNTKDKANSQNKIISTLKDLVFKVLVQKIGKEQYQSDAEFLLRRVQQLKPLLLEQTNRL